MSKRRSAVKAIISKARSAENQNTRIPESAAGDDDELVNLGVKVLAGAPAPLGRRVEAQRRIHDERDHRCAR